jgi:hypothetical protein
VIPIRRGAVENPDRETGKRMLSVDQHNLGARTIPPTDERELLHHWYDCDNPSLWAAGQVFLDGPDHAKKS